MALLDIQTDEAPHGTQGFKTNFSPVQHHPLPLRAMTVEPWRGERGGKGGGGGGRLHTAPS
jgi:hypothetical protein